MLRLRPKNESGLRLRFERDGDAVTTSYKASDHHQGFPGVLHGGVLSALLDEVMSRVSVVEGPLDADGPHGGAVQTPGPCGLHRDGGCQEDQGAVGVIEAEGRVLLADGSVAAEASGTFAPVTDEALAEMSSGYPKLSREWMVNRG